MTFMVINNMETDVFYGLFIGHTYINKAELIQRKQWTMCLYDSERGRKQALLYHRREYGQYCDFLIFELKPIDLFNRSVLATVIPKQLYNDADVLLFVQEKRKKPHGN